MIGTMKGTLRFSFLRKLSTVAEKCAEHKPAHIAVLAEEALHYLKPEKDQVILDMTFGAGGHSRRILESAPNIKLLALDRDPTAFQYAQKLSEEYPHQVTPLLGCFSELPNLLKAESVKQNSIDSIIFDFGCSSMQFDEAERGFSVSKNGPLDMRMDGNRCPDSPTASDVLAKASEEDIYKIIKYYGEEKQARKIARAIIDARYLFKKLTTTEELADLVESVCTEDFRFDKLQRRTHVATKTFQALRIFVNNELNEINYGLILAHRYLKIGGRIVTITFQSLEDTIVKRHLSGNLIENTANPLPLKYSSHMNVGNEELIEDLMDPNWKLLHKHVIVPKYEEVENNPRSRSAKLRAAVKVK
ncbi:probable methyltransferase-like protein 15 homolog [Anoplophora glabripennis]|uniref:probable methyltransferase-like protein 15 homolog n=1 Tax=Anoplophora glabripennis TaxID=217634 RepID=UPI000873B1D6|nr:probable methyltransferase-like protein 15 homolog [Anoplophora glabripennis]